ncbi:pentatricopeptide repeat-containing protein At1g71460, chloroplastic [Magnolia sinica]|uniref:pentatricopeptide repeat-containing protein At1g71460, chloroplastic n=1 Tax=Magnolia sinica TaxID=86752 RepID=UPI002658A1F8|nr:pentatricopeptide repeat-containing protein At1g71460, chloroplastic [Magnolia sinica]
MFLKSLQTRHQLMEPTAPLLPNPSPIPSKTHNAKHSPSFQFHRQKRSIPLPTLFKTTRSCPSIQTHQNPPKNLTKTQRFKERDVFPQSLPLHSKNPHVVYKDIQKFARQGRLKEALTILDYLEKEGIPVNPTTFSSLLFACVRSKSLIQGKQIHVHIRINGLEKNEFLCTKLVQMYTACGSFEDAKRVFDEIQQRSVYPWNALLRGNVIEGGMTQRRDTLSIYSRMRELGVDLNEYTFSCLIKSFAGSPTLGQGMKAHALLIKYGFIGSVLLKTSLIDMYFKCGKIRLARQIFEELLEKERDIVVWGAMIAGFAHNRLRREALEYLRWMTRHGIKPNSVLLTIILPVIGELSAWILGREVHGYVIKTKSYAKQLFIQSALIDMYCKCGDMGSGRRVFYCSMERNAVSWTALMSGYASNGRLEQALRSIVWMQQEGIKPDVVSIATVLPVCGELRALKHGKEIHGYAVKNRFLPNVSIVTSLMIMYSKCGRLEYSRKLFDGMEKRNVISWTAMIDSYLKNGCPYDALGVFRSMQLSKHRPDSVAMARMLAVSGELSSLKLGKEIHGQILKKDLGSVPFVSAAIINMYGRCGEIDKAKFVFNAVPSKGSMTWTAIIEAYGYNDLYRDALDHFNRMKMDGFNPNHFTFDVVLSICSRAGFDDEALKIFYSMGQRYNIKASEKHYSCIIDLLTRVGRINEAQKFIHMKSTMV